MSQFQENPAQPGSQQPASEPESRIEASIPVWREELQVGTRVLETGKGVRIHKSVTEDEQVIDLLLKHEELSVQHVPLGTWVESETPPEVRYEGDTLVVPVLEEVLVVEKKLRLKEELRITRQSHETHTPQRVILRSEKVSVERFDRLSPADKPDPPPD